VSTERAAQRLALEGVREEALVHKKCVACEILLDVPCANTVCGGHKNESRGDLCVYCATNEREHPLFLRPHTNLMLSSLADMGSAWTEQEERAMLEL
jgi:hypothetical protein